MSIVTEKFLGTGYKVDIDGSETDYIHTRTFFSFYFFKLPPPVLVDSF